MQNLWISDVFDQDLLRSVEDGVHEPTMDECIEPFPSGFLGTMPESLC